MILTAAPRQSLVSDKLQQCYQSSSTRMKAGSCSSSNYADLSVDMLGSNTGRLLQAAIRLLREAGSSRLFWSKLLMCWYLHAAPRLSYIPVLRALGSLPAKISSMPSDIESHRCTNEQCGQG